MNGDWVGPADRPLADNIRVRHVPDHVALLDGSPQMRAIRTTIDNIADKGTIYLDEIADLPLALQAKLLHVLQDFRFSRVGGHGSIGVDTRVVAATNWDLEYAMTRGEFREDLYYRLNVVEIRIPPLRE